MNFWRGSTGTGRNRPQALGIGVAKYFLDATGNGMADIVQSFNDFDDTNAIGNWDGLGRDNTGTVKIVGGGLRWILRNDDGSVTEVNFAVAQRTRLEITIHIRPI